MESVVLTRDEFETALNENRKKGYGTIIKFTAGWCGPCKTIQSLVQTLVSEIPADCKLACYELDVDVSFDLYAVMKRSRMVNGIPTLLYYSAATNTARSDDSVSGSNEQGIRGFFERSIQNAMSIAK
jgi:thiol-disulfide isomerase/thioredoxin